MLKLEDELRVIGEKIEKAALGLGFYVEDIDIYLLSERQMLAPLALSGAPRRYAHWSFGKKAETFNRLMEQKGISVSSLDSILLYDLPHVPILGTAQLYKQVSAIIRAYAQVDFMRQSYQWRNRDFDEMRFGMDRHAGIIQRMIDTPKIGALNVENALSAAHGLVYQCSHTASLYGRCDDVLLEISEKSPGVEEWIREIFSIVHQEWLWFLPFIETLFMVKGWIGFWQKRILEEADLPEELYWRCLFEFSNEIRVPNLALVNPAAVGYRIFEEIFEKKCRSDAESFRRTAQNILKYATDTSFIIDHLTHESAERAGLLSYGQRAKEGDDAKILEVRDIADDVGWEKVRDELVSWVGGSAFPAVRVRENSGSVLRLEHQFDGRPLRNDENTKGVFYSLREILARNVIFIHSSLDQSGNESKTETTFAVGGTETSKSLNAPPPDNNYE